MLVGPTEDKANISRAKTVLDAFALIYNSSHPFLSRSDSSGTFCRNEDMEEAKSNLKNTAVNGTSSQVKEWGRLNIAISLNAYILTDRSTWLRFKIKEII